MTNDDKSLVFDYFRLIKEKDIDGLLDLFTDDAVLYEPFSKLSTVGDGLRDRNAMKAFFQVAVMANDGLEYSITSKKAREVDEEYTINRNDINNSKNINNVGKAQNSSVITALVRFERGRSANARFIFETVKCSAPNILKCNQWRGERTHETRKIKNLRIEFLNQ